MNQDELVLEGKTYVSSKRAAQMTEYAQDYIGQLCRSGVTDAKRVSGLWYVTLESLQKHKITSAEVKAQAFANMNSAEFSSPKSDTILTFSGEEYVSSRHGAEITGYNPDYITQLARWGKIRSRQVGSRWYVSKVDLVSNKEKNDALLAEVQTSAVGLAMPIPVQTNIYNKKDEATFEKHESESHLPLMPNLPEKTLAPVMPIRENEPHDSAYKVVTPVSINAAPLASFPDRKPSPQSFSGIKQMVVPPSPLRTYKPKRTSGIVKALVATVTAVTITVGGYYGVEITLNGESRGFANTASASLSNLPGGSSWYGKAFYAVIGTIVPLVTAELNYVRS